MFKADSVGENFCPRRIFSTSYRLGQKFLPNETQPAAGVFGVYLAPLGAIFSTLVDFRNILLMYYCGLTLLLGTVLAERSVSVCGAVKVPSHVVSFLVFSLAMRKPSLFSNF